MRVAGCLPSTGRTADRGIQYCASTLEYVEHELLKADLEREICLPIETAECVSRSAAVGRNIGTEDGRNGAKVDRTSAVNTAHKRENHAEGRFFSVTRSHTGKGDSGHGNC